MKFSYDCDNATEQLYGNDLCHNVNDLWIILPISLKVLKAISRDMTWTERTSEEQAIHPTESKS